LKVLARGLDIPIVGLAQLNRLKEQRKDKRPLLSDLRESGSLEQDADVVMLLHRPEEHETEDSALVEVIVAKSRAGPKGIRTLVHYKKYFDLRDWAGPDPSP
jgi:replicative DNA helicase